MTLEEAEVDLKTVDHLLQSSLPEARLSILQALMRHGAHCQYISGESILTPHGYKHTYTIRDETEPCD